MQKMFLFYDAVFVNAKFKKTVFQKLFQPLFGFLKSSRVELLIRKRSVILGEMFFGVIFCFLVKFIVFWKMKGRCFFIFRIFFFGFRCRRSISRPTVFRLSSEYFG